MKATIDITPEQLEVLNAFLKLFKEKQQEQAEQQRREIRVTRKLLKKRKGGESNGS